MKLAHITDRPSEWMEETGRHHKIVISSRIRFARNLRETPFPGWAKKSERIEILDQIKKAVDALPEMQDGFSEFLQDLTALEKQILVERHLISREHAAKSIASAVVINRPQTLSVMINEEDHLRMQSLRPGLQLEDAFRQIDKVDTALEGVLDFAWDNTLGYLTACPTNVGTGMRASAMVHLPALMLSEQMDQVVQAVNKIGLVVRGLYGEGTEAMGNLFQVSNQTTLGEKEEEIIDRLTKVIETIIGHEENARQNLLEKKPETLMDNIGRAYGILRNAYSMTSKEALNWLSFIRLGIDLEIFPEAQRLAVDELFMETQPAHLQKSAEKKLTASERDSLRAGIIRAKLRELPCPDHSCLEQSTEENNTQQIEQDE